MVGLIDLNTTEEGETTPYSSSSSASSVCLELWHACAGPLISLPKKGSLVVYFPQGHLDQLPPDSSSSSDHLPPAHLFCRVVDVKLHAEAASDEVYAQVSLVPQKEQSELKWRKERRIEGDVDDEDAELPMNSSTPHMFCKTLTASDTSTHGGFSVPRRAAEDCFPPLDHTQQRPSQELVAKDLHGFEWRFRHIYRGQPRRHLLTTGWSAFVNKKKLVSGDAVLFLRGEDGELRLGVRRGTQVKPSATLPAALCSQLSNRSSISDVASAVATRSVFNVCYNPRASSSEFVIPLKKFIKSLDYSYCAGMRFKMRFETEDADERRYSGMITGISDLDPAKWPGSKWRCLMVRWDDDMEVSRHSRVSPWEIEASGSLSSSCHSFLGSGLKRTRSALPDFTVPDGPDFGESSSMFHKVLQGQEISSFSTFVDADRNQGHQFPVEQTRCYPGRGPGLGNNGPHDVSYKGIGFGESSRFQRVLQGQEILPSSPVNGCLGGIQASARTPSLRNGWSVASSPPSVLMFQQASNRGNQHPGHAYYNPNRNMSQHWFDNNKMTGEARSLNGSMEQLASSHEPSSCKTSCMLFGFSLTEDKSSNIEIASPVMNPEAVSVRQFHQSRPVVGGNFSSGTLQQHYAENYHIY
ncbi:Auxin response factor 3 [Linum perenne]